MSEVFLFLIFPYSAHDFTKVQKALQSLKTKRGESREKVSSLVPEAGIEPALPKEQDFESSASTSSATRAYVK